MGCETDLLHRQRERPWLEGCGQLQWWLWQNAWLLRVCPEAARPAGAASARCGKTGGCLAAARGGCPVAAAAAALTGRRTPWRSARAAAAALAAASGASRWSVRRPYGGGLRRRYTQEAMLQCVLWLAAGRPPQRGCPCRPLAGDSGQLGGACWGIRVDGQARSGRHRRRLRWRVMAAEKEAAGASRMARGAAVEAAPEGGFRLATVERPDQVASRCAQAPRRWAG